MYELVYEVEGRPQRYRLTGPEVFLGRSSENEVVLNDFSVSRRHAVIRQEKDRWVIVDQNSTNGVKVNGRFVASSPIAPGDVLTVGTFSLTVREEAPAVKPKAPVRPVGESSSTFVRSIADFNRDFHLEEYVPEEEGDALTQSGKRSTSALGQRGKESEDAGEIFSHTIVESVIQNRVAVLTSDALADGRFEAGQSIRIQQIRSAMCVPLWNQDRVIGALHVDTPLRAGSFTADDLDLLTALGNFAAVAIERARLQRRIEKEERIRERLSRYHSPGVVEEIASDASGVIDRVRTRNVSVFFADIVGFTSAAEGMDPDSLSRFLSTFFTFAADAIFAEGGTLDKFIGDAVMAFFGAPIVQPDHARRAVSAAAKLVENVKAWNLERVARGEPPVGVRIGVNTGNAVVGDIGSEQRVDYTVLGNTVNVAARIEEYVAGPNEVAVGEETARLTSDDFSYEPLGDVKLKGLSRGLPCYRVKMDARGVPLPAPR